MLSVSFRCSSYVGRIGGRQTISVGNADGSIICRHGNIVHEIAHSVGFFHEHSRPDRDDYVNVHWGNVESGWYWTSIVVENWRAFRFPLLWFFPLNCIILSVNVYFQLSFEFWNSFQKIFNFVEILSLNLLPIWLDWQLRIIIVSYVALLLNSSKYP